VTSSYAPTWITRETAPRLRALRPMAQAVYLVLADQRGFTRSGWRGSVRQLAVLAGRSRRSVQRAVDDLVAAGLLECDTHHQWSTFRWCRKGATQETEWCPKGATSGAQREPLSTSQKDRRESLPTERDSFPDTSRSKNKEEGSARARPGGPPALPAEQADRPAVPLAAVPAYVHEWVATLKESTTLPPSVRDAPTLSDDELAERKRLLIEQARRMQG
jgi:hypothetical protein